VVSHSQQYHASGKHAPVLCAFLRRSCVRFALSVTWLYTRKSTAVAWPHPVCGYITKTSGFGSGCELSSEYGKWPSRKCEECVQLTNLLATFNVVWKLSVLHNLVRNFWASTTSLIWVKLFWWVNPCSSSDSIRLLQNVLFWFILFKNRYSFSPNINEMYFKLVTCLLSFLVLIETSDKHFSLELWKHFVAARSCTLFENSFSISFVSELEINCFASFWLKVVINLLCIAASWFVRMHWCFKALDCVQ